VELKEAVVAYIYVGLLPEICLAGLHNRPGTENRSLIRRFGDFEAGIYVHIAEMLPTSPGLWMNILFVRILVTQVIMEIQLSRNPKVFFFTILQTQPLGPKLGHIN
jgi:hypothetical protein